MFRLSYIFSKANIIDSGAMDHMAFDPSQLLSRKSITPSDILMGKMIGCGTRRGKLYYLDCALDSETKVGQTFTISGASSERQRDQ
ncbi:unnamed protein product, partial [Prunus brigantina]